MRILFLGSGTSHGVPMIGCDCAVCRSTDARDKRLRPSIVIDTDDGQRVLVDTTPDLRSQALAYGLRTLDAVLFTHTHADHIMGLDDVRSLTARGQAMPCFGAPAALAEIRRVFSYVFDKKEHKGGGIPALDLWPVAGPFCLGRQEITPVPVLHGDRLIFGFRLGRFAYLTDCSGIPESSFALLSGLDVLVLDALRHRPHPTHFTVAEATRAAGRIGARQTYFTHICHQLGHAETCAALPPGITLAHDGLTLDVGACAAGAAMRPVSQ